MHFRSLENHPQSVKKLRFSDSFDPRKVITRNTTYQCLWWPSLNYHKDKRLSERPAVSTFKEVLSQMCQRFGAVCCPRLQGSRMDYPEGGQQTSKPLALLHQSARCKSLKFRIFINTAMKISCLTHQNSFFFVLLTVRLSIILVPDQLNAQILVL